MTILLCDILARSGSCFQLASKCAGLWCEMAGLAAALFSAQLASQKNHRETAEAYHFFFLLFHLHVTAEWFSSICLLWSQNSFGKKENKWLSLQSLKRPLGTSHPSSSVLHLTDLGKGGGLRAEKSINHLSGKSSTSLEATYSRHPTTSQAESKIRKDIGKPVGAAFFT